MRTEIPSRKRPPHRDIWRTAMLPVLLVCTTGVLFGQTPQHLSSLYDDIVLRDEPIAYWNWQLANPSSEPTSWSPLVGGDILSTRQHGGIQLTAGPRPPFFPLFSRENSAVTFASSNQYLVITDPGSSSPLDFDQGDTITIEAWVNPRSLKGAAFHHILQKGRTGNPGFAAHNQNYALRLKSPTGQLSFLFRSRGPQPDWHRWTSKLAIGVGDGWHHIVVTYTFGEPKSIRALIDGVTTSGTWDMGGATTRPPVVDNDQLWIGNMLDGRLDAVAIYRHALPVERVRAHYRYQEPDISAELLPRLRSGRVLVDIQEGIPDQKSWRLRYRPPDESFFVDALALPELPHKYSERAVRVDRKQPFLVRASAQVVFPPGPQRLVVRSHDAAKLMVDGNIVATTPFFNISSSAHGKVIPLDKSLGDQIRPLHRGHQQAVWNVEGDGKPHLVVLETIVGRSGRRPELGETWVGIGPIGGRLQLVGFGSPVEVTDEGWRSYVKQFRRWRIGMDAQRRADVGIAENAYWQQRHEFARTIWQARRPAPPDPSATYPRHNAIDDFVNEKLAEHNIEPTPLVDDLAFLRRVTLDTWGLVPSPELIEHFTKLPRATRRQQIIDELIADARWADHWVGYWQDVLAENPNIIKPTLNNSGPFRWWIYESFYDNKPMDRFATELMLMEGSKYFGGPAGFELAFENDVPMAAKARIVAQAFLGVELKCSRCHDDPYRAYKQRDLFELAAMLKRGPQEVPSTSSIPGGEQAAQSLLVDVTLLPGEKVPPSFPFTDLLEGPLDEQFLRDGQDSREQLALWITSPRNARFPRVLANRVWQFYFGRGLVEPVDDWHEPATQHAELLDFLAYQLVTHGYDLKHLARLILNSHAYQREARSAKGVDDATLALFPHPLRRRMRAEQLVDSMFRIAGKPFATGPITLDTDGALPTKTALNLGEPERAWQFASLSNERDRPSLSMPFAQPFVGFMQAFGWRSSRQDPLTVREQVTTVLQPAMVQNSLITQRITRLSDDSALTALALQDQPLDDLVDALFLRILTRRPDAEEREWFRETLAPGYRQRRREAPIVPKPQPPQGDVSWSNHLSSRANEIKLELQRAVEMGDPPTRRLDPDWRQRLEDAIWVLINSPEFTFVP